MRADEPSGARRPPALVRSTAWLGAGAAVLIAVSALVFVAVRGPATGGSLDDRVRAVASGLRCPVCQNLSVADSPSRLAQQMRTTIAAELRDGKDPEEIRNEFVAAYGDWILLSPPRRGLDLVAWVAPALLLVGGLLMAAVAVRRWTVASAVDPRDGDRPRADQSPANEALVSEDRALLARAMAEYEDGSP
jgi:cytochrome c-type biogenesis protein CcmH